MNRTLNDIGFYTMREDRCKNASASSPLWRCELILTSRCNFKCPYCRGLKSDYTGDMPTSKALHVLSIWIANGLKNVRFSGGEPTLYKELPLLVATCKSGDVERIAVSTNGTASLDYYKRLIDLGVNDFSISLDSGCCSTGDKMTGGVKSGWDKAVEAITELSKLTYVTVGVVFTEANIGEAVTTVEFIDSLNVGDIRVIPSAQFNVALSMLNKVRPDLVQKYPIFNYRITNISNGRHVRGITENDCNKCHLVLDDMAVVGNKHYPCIIYLREQGNPIGNFGGDVREQRLKWFQTHDSYADPICRGNCLDVCIDYNNRKETYLREEMEQIISNSSLEESLTRV